MSGLYRVAFGFLRMNKKETKNILKYKLNRNMSKLKIQQMSKHRRTEDRILMDDHILEGTANEYLEQKWEQIDEEYHGDTVREEN